jgi:hypothetical protein
LAIPVNTCPKRIYKIVQIANEANIPIGMSFLGFLHSWAAVEIASKPINAKKTTPAELIIPLQPNFPKLSPEI